jgi:hypothetical protein
MINFYRALNGPYAKDENEGNEFVTHYSIGRNVIYSAFSWSLAEKAYEKMKSLAEKYNVDFYDASAYEGDILFLDGIGRNIPIDRAINMSSIQEIKKWPAPDQENMSVKEILYSKLNLPATFENSTKLKKSN